MLYRPHADANEVLVTGTFDQASLSANSSLSTSTLSSYLLFMLACIFDQFRHPLGLCTVGIGHFGPPMTVCGLADIALVATANNTLIAMKLGLAEADKRSFLGL